MAKKRTTTTQTAQQQTTMLNRAAIYLRVSTDEQAKDGYGLDVQRERCRAQAIAKGWQIANEYSDEGISGTKDSAERPGLAAILAEAEAGRIDAIIVLALDRLGRKTNIVLDIAEKCRQWGTALVSCKESLDTATPQGQFVLTMFAALAQLERDTIVERTTAGRDERGRRDGEKGGKMPHGYERGSDGEIIINEAAAATVRRIFDLHTKGLSLRKIVSEIACEPAPRAKQWYPMTVKLILDNEEYYRGNPRNDSANKWPIILDPVPIGRG